MLVEKHLLDKRDEIIWSLADQQDYSPAQIGKIFNIIHISTVVRIIARKPSLWQSPWMKRNQIVKVEVRTGNGVSDLRT